MIEDDPWTIILVLVQMFQKLVALVVDLIQTTKATQENNFVLLEADHQKENFLIGRDLSMKAGS